MDGKYNGDFLNKGFYSTTGILTTHVLCLRNKNNLLFYVSSSLPQGLIFKQWSTSLWANKVKVKTVFKLLTKYVWRNGEYSFLLSFLSLNTFFSFSFLFLPFLSGHSFGQAHYFQRLCWAAVSQLCYLNHMNPLTSIFQA